MITAKEALTIQQQKLAEKALKLAEKEAQKKLQDELYRKDNIETHIPNALNEIDSLIRQSLENGDPCVYYGVKANPLIKEFLDEIHSKILKLGFRVVLVNLGPNELKNHPELSQFALKIYWDHLGVQ